VVLRPCYHPFMHFRRTLCCFLVSLIAACGKGADSETADSGSGDKAPLCSTVVTSTDPGNGSMDHYYRDPIRFYLSEPDPTAQVITDMVGETRREDGGSTIVFEPRGNLSPSTEYSAGLDYCYGEPEITFTTSHYGVPLEASADLSGRAYSIAFNSGEYTVGENAGELLNAVFTRPVLVQFEEVNGGFVDITAAIGMPGVQPPQQDMCARTITLRQVSINELPFLSGGVADFEFGAQGGILRFASLTFEGTVSSDASTLGGIAYDAVMGAEEIVSLLPEFGNLDSVCDLAENLGIPCSPCPNDSARQCIPMAAKGIYASQIDETLVSIAEAGTHEECGAAE